MTRPTSATSAWSRCACTTYAPCPPQLFQSLTADGQFLSTSARALKTLAAQHKAIRSAQPLAEALARRADVLRERAAGFKTAMDARRGQDVGGWAAFDGAMGEVGAQFPAPSAVAAAA
jgi:hypothetical protein